MTCLALILSEAGLLVANTTNSLLRGYIKIFAQLIWLRSGPLLSTTGANMITIDCDEIICSPLPNTSAVVCNSSTSKTVIKVDQLTINGIGPIERPMIDHLAGSFDIEAGSYIFTNQVTGIRTTSGTASINITNVSSSSIFYQTSGVSVLISENINSSGNAIIVTGGTLDCKISNITFTSAGAQSLTVSGDGACSGYISNVITNNGSIIESTSTNDINLIYNKFRVNGNPVVGSSVIGINLAGSGNVKLLGNVLDTNNAFIGVRVANTCRLGLHVNNLLSNTNQILFDLTSDLPGGMDLDFMKINVTNPIVAQHIFNISNGETTVRGGTINRSTVIPVFNVSGSSRLVASVQNINCPAGLLIGDTTSSVDLTFGTLKAINV